LGRCGFLRRRQFYRHGLIEALDDVGLTMEKAKSIDSYAAQASQAYLRA
jgi:3-isopropylmalate dehydratase small subunit